MPRTQDACVDFAGEISHAIRSDFDGFITWNHLNESREDYSSIDLLIADGKPPSFASITIDGHKFVEDEESTILVEIIATMRLDDSIHEVDLKTVATKSILDKYKRLRPIVITGTLQRLGGKNEPRIVSSRTLEVRIRIFEGEFADRVDSSVLSEPGIAAVEKLEALFEIYRAVKMP